MTEKINGQGFRPADAAGARRTDAAKPRAEGGAAASSAKSTSTSDTVNFTRSGLLMSKLEEVVQKSPVVDAGRVRAIKDALTAGKYEIDDQAVADGLLRFDRELLA